jgi:selenocysteine-specific elongation factor
LERSIVVGTAGHIDHGKSALVRALTGTDPDRLKEEKERGITIDLGFAHLSLGDGAVASFIDVPGHERFVRNMLAGAHGIDAVLLVVAADEGVMPQTREHFHICRFLGLTEGALVLTKCDLASPEVQAVAELELRELVAGSFLEGAPLLRTSARTGAGLDALRDALRGLARGVDARGHGGLLRLPVDRAFSVRGFGTVVTGTLVRGEVGIDDEVAILPRGRRARVRGVEVHGEAVRRVGAGHRTAVNLAGVEVQDIVRGDVLVLPSTLEPTVMIDAEIFLLEGPKPLKNQARVRLHLGAAEILARIHLLEGGSFAQLRLETPGVAGRGDRFILRSYSPASTIGGGIVLDPHPEKHRKRDEAAHLSRLRALRAATPPEAAVAFVEAAGTFGVRADALAARTTLPIAELLAATAADPRVVRLGGTPGAFLAASALEALSARTLAFLEDFHRKNPLKGAITREELRHKVFEHAPEGALDAVLAKLGPRLALSPETVALQGAGVRLTDDEERARGALLESARAAGLQGVEVGKLGRGAPERVAKVLVNEGALSRVGQDLLVHREALEALKRDVRARWPPGSRLDVGELKELTGLTRKFVIPLLEYLDRERITRRSGADRMVLP